MRKRIEQILSRIHPTSKSRAAENEHQKSTDALDDALENANTASYRVQLSIAEAMQIAKNNSAQIEMTVRKIQQ